MKIRGSFQQEISSSKFCAGQSSDLSWFLALGSAPSFRRIAVADIGRSIYVTRRRFFAIARKKPESGSRSKKAVEKLATFPDPRVYAEDEAA